jgi:ATP-binding cassette subfamily B multidrug efflux pump
MSKLSRLIGGFVRQHSRAYALSGAMLAGVATLTVWVPRKVGAMIDGLAAHTLSGNALLMEIGSLLLIGAGIYFLRVGWRQILYGAAYQLGVSLRTRLYARLTLQGPGLLPAPAHRRPDGAGHQRHRRHRNGRRRRRCWPASTAR